MRRRPRTGSFVLSKYQKNDLFHAIEIPDEIPIAEFDLRMVNVKGCASAEIRHLPTDSYFRIEEYTKDPDGAGLYRITSAPGINAILANSHRFTDWRRTLSFTQNWVGLIRLNLEEKEKYDKIPDLWEMLRQDKEFLFTREDTANTPFTASEQRQIAEQLTQVKEYIKASHQLTEAQLAKLETTIDHVEEASKRLGRKDWILLFNGAVFSLILTDLITPQTAQHVLLITVQALGHLFGHGMPPGHLPPP